MKKHSIVAHAISILYRQKLTRQYVQNDNFSKKKKHKPNFMGTQGPENLLEDPEKHKHQCELKILGQSVSEMSLLTCQ